MTPSDVILQIVAQKSFQIPFQLIPAEKYVPDHKSCMLYEDLQSQRWQSEKNHKQGVENSSYFKSPFSAVYTNSPITSFAFVTNSGTKGC